MPPPDIVPLPPRQNFDRQLFYRLARIEELSDRDEDLVATRWSQFRELASAYRIKGAEGSWFLAWLDEKAENVVDADWKASPSRGFLVHVLAVTYLMSLAGTMVPEIAGIGCAPVPEPSEELARAAGSLGLEFMNPYSLKRRYSLLTPYPYSGGCSLCHLREDCPQQGVYQDAEQ